MLNNLGTVTLVTERLVLRRFEQSDAEDVYHYWAGDEDVTKYLSWSSHSNAEHTRNYIGQCLEQYENKDFYYWAITPRDSGIAVGFVGLVRVDEIICSADIAYALSKQYWNRGFATEAATAVLRFCFEKIGFNRIRGAYHVGNPVSGSVLEKIGMRYEGTLKQAQKDNKGNYCDVAQYAILKDDWTALQAENQAGGRSYVRVPDV